MDLEKIKTDYNEKLAKMQEEMQTVLKDAFKEIFEKAPHLAAITWTQYTPYFNDGDECTFSVHDAYLLTDGYEEELGEDFNFDPYDADGAESAFLTKPVPFYFESDSSWAKDAVSNWKKWEHKEESELVESMINSVFGIDNDIFRACFGDHAKVLATREKFIIEEYSHD